MSCFERARRYVGSKDVTVTVVALDSNTEWMKWGQTDPMYAVASWAGRRKQDERPWTPEEFYALGVQDWNDFRLRWARYGMDAQCCVEIGCGAGRITRALSTDFNTVHAVDVSESMLEVAKQNVTSRSVKFHLSDGITLPIDSDIATSVFSCHVFQHLDSLPIALECFREATRVLQPGGTLMIHVPIYEWPFKSRLLSAAHSIRAFGSLAKARVQRQFLKHGVGKPLMRWLTFPIPFIYEHLPALGLVDVELLTLQTKSNGAPHTFILARKS